jgi:hypothetical protein
MEVKKVSLIIPFLFVAGMTAGQSMAAEWTPDSKLVERGHYLARAFGCNDCHTPGYLLSEGKVSEEHWLSGDNFGWRGPWGTTYASNLRLFMANISEDEWVATAQTLKRRPPMPWFNVNKMHEEDLRALYHFIRSFKELGELAPAYVPPDIEPSPPYATFPSPPQ